MITLCVSFIYPALTLSFIFCNFSESEVLSEYYQNTIRILSEYYQKSISAMASTRSAMQQQKPPLRIFEQPDAAAVSHIAGVKPPGPPGRRTVTRFECEGAIFYACTLLTRGPQNTNICQLCWHLEPNTQLIQKTAFLLQNNSCPTTRGTRGALCPWLCSTSLEGGAGCAFRRMSTGRPAVLIKQRAASLGSFLASGKRTNNLRMLRMIQTVFVVSSLIKGALCFIFSRWRDTNHSVIGPTPLDERTRMCIHIHA